MDSLRFDRWVRGIIGVETSRHGFVRLALGTGVAAVAGGALVEDAAACRRNGGRCRRDRQCCSGTCRKRESGIGKCRPAPGAAGCTTKRDTCAAPAGAGPVPCPLDPSGICVVLDNGRPFCARLSGCSPCTSDQFCVNDFENLSARCITSCAACPDTNGRMCVAAARS